MERAQNHCSSSRLMMMMVGLASGVVMTSFDSMDAPLVPFLTHVYLFIEGRLPSAYTLICFYSLILKTNMQLLFHVLSLVLSNHNSERISNATYS